MNKIALYPGSFNPIHNLHIEIIKEASKQYEKLYVLVANNELKNYSILLLERFEMAKKAVLDLGLSNVEVIKQNGGFTPLIAKQLGARTIIRGLKGSDKVSNYEDRLADAFLDMNDDLSFNYIIIEGNELSSTIIREKVKNRKEISNLVPNVIKKELKAMYEKI